MARSQIVSAPKTPPHTQANPKPTAAQPQLRRAGASTTEGKGRPTTSAMVLELHGGEELLFQFYGREGWVMAEPLGTVSLGQASLAERKLLQLSRSQRRGKRANLGYKLWRNAGDTASDTDEEEASENHLDPNSSSCESNGKEMSSSDGASSGGESSSGEESRPEENANGTDEGSSIASKANARFWRFSRKDLEEQQAAASASTLSSNGWTVLDDSSHAFVSVDASETIGSSEFYEQESDELNAEAISPLESWNMNGTAGHPTDAELRNLPGSTSGREGGLVRREASMVGFLAAVLASLNSASRRMVQGCTGALRQGLRNVQATWFACLFLTRAAWWAVKGRPQPPQLHASPTLARLRACRNAIEAKRSSLDAGFDLDGKTAEPLADLPRWRVEALVGTHVCDMSLYRRALTSPTAVEDVVGASYERLEYVGDAVLGLIIREYIYSKYPGVTEHAMCTMVSTLVSGRTLHDFARGLRLEHYLALNAEEQYSMRSMTGYANGALADAFEALLGALFMDRGYAAARAFVLHLVEEVVDMERLPLNRDYKGVLGTILRLRGMGRAVYRSRARMGLADPARASYPLVPRAPAGGGPHLIWVSEVSVGDMVVSGSDIHRPTAEQQAARAALQALGLPLEELSLVEADQLTMLDIARSLPGLPDRPDPATYVGNGAATGTSAAAGNGNGAGGISASSNGAGSNGSSRAGRRTPKGLKWERQQPAV